MRTSRLFRGSGDEAAAIDGATEAPGPDMQAGGSQPVDRCAPAPEGHPPRRTPQGTDHPTATRRRPTIGNAPEHEAVGPNTPTGGGMLTPVVIVTHEPHMARGALNTLAMLDGRGTVHAVDDS